MELHVDFLADRPQNNGQSSLGYRYTLEKKKAAWWWRRRALIQNSWSHFGNTNTWTWVQVQTADFAPCMTLGKVLHASEPQFPLL